MDGQKIQSHLNDIYQKHFDQEAVQISPLQGDGSDRLLYRLIDKNSSTVIGVFGPNFDENEAFISFSYSFEQLGLPVPSVLTYDSSLGMYLLTDLGDTTLMDWYNVRKHLKSSWHKIENMYKHIIEYLLLFQFQGYQSIDFTKCYQYEIFGADAIQHDLSYFENSFLARYCRIKYNREKLYQDFQKLIQRLLQADNRYFLYRDFQSKNIMIQQDRPHFIDYQSGRKGALQYDLASLLFDANLVLPNKLRNEMLHYYLNKANQYNNDFDQNSFLEYYNDFVLIRMLQALAAFSYLCFEKKKTYFERNVPNAVSSIALLLEQKCTLCELSELRHIFEDDIFPNHLPIMID